MNRIVRRSTIVAVALATTLGAGAALAANTGVSPEVLKSALGSSGATSTSALALKSSTIVNAERFAGFESAADQNQFAALKTSAFNFGQVGIAAPGEDETIAFRAALAKQGEADSSFGADAEDCASKPVKLADASLALRQLSNPSGIGEDTASFSRALQSEAIGDLADYRRYAADSAFEQTASFSTIKLALANDGTNNTSFAAQQTSDIAEIKAALNGSSDAFGALSNDTSASELASAFRKS